MSKIKIITDTCCSLSAKEILNWGADYVETTISIDDQYFSAFDCPIKDHEEFYETIKNAKKVSTGCVNQQTFIDIFQKYAHQGYDCVYVGLSSGLSSTFNNAFAASEYVNKTCGQHIWVADSLTGGFSIAKMVEYAVKMAAENYTAEQIYNKINKNAIKTLVYFVPFDLHFLAKAGRLNKIVATVSSAIKLVPILSANSEGKLKLIGKTIGRKKAIKTLHNLLLDNMDLSSEETIYIGHTGQYQEAQQLSQFINQIAPNKRVEIGYIDYTLACCCGPETLAIFASAK